MLLKIQHVRLVLSVNMITPTSPQELSRHILVIVDPGQNVNQLLSHFIWNVTIHINDTILGHLIDRFLHWVQLLFSKHKIDYTHVLRDCSTLSLPECVRKCILVICTQYARNRS